MIAEYLENLGFTVTKNLREGVQGAGRQGDAYVNGVLHEFKTAGSGATSNTIRNQVNQSKKGTGQAREIIVDARNSGLSEADALRGTYLALGSSRGKVDGITVIGDGYFFRSVPKAN